MLKEGDDQPVFFPQEYQGEIVVIGATARITRLKAKDFKSTSLAGLSFLIRIRDDHNRYYVENVGKWIEQKNNEPVRLIISIPFPEKPANYGITLISQKDEKDLIFFEA